MFHSNTCSIDTIFCMKMAADYSDSICIYIKLCKIISNNTEFSRNIAMIGKYIKESWMVGAIMYTWIRSNISVNIGFFLAWQLLQMS